MQRRDFLRNSSLAMAGLITVPDVRFNDDLVLGQNKKRYKIDTKWSKADVSRYPVNDCHEMIQDKQGRIVLLTNETKNNVLIYAKDGKLLSNWGTEYPGLHWTAIRRHTGNRRESPADKPRPRSCRWFQCIFLPSYSDCRQWRYLCCRWLRKGLCYSL